VYEGDVIVKWFVEDRIKPQLIHLQNLTKTTPKEAKCPKLQPILIGINFLINQAGRLSMTAEGGVRQNSRTKIIRATYLHRIIS
jgi:hypothetical protein